MPENNKDKNKDENKDRGTGTDPSGSPGGDDAPGVGRTRQLLRVLHGPRAPEHARLHDEVVRLHLGKEFHPSELVEASIKISPRGFSQQRYGACISWRPDQRGQLAESALNAAPTEAVRRALALALPGPMSGVERSPEPPALAARDAELREWIERSARYFACVAYDFDARLYKMYRFKHRPVHYLEDLDLVERAAELPALAYIRSLELHMDAPEQRRLPLYFKLRFAGEPVGPATTTEPSQPPRRPAAGLLEPGFTPHPLLAPRVLSAAPDREAVVRSLRRFLADLTPAQDPVVKLVPPARAEDLLALDYGVSVNLLDPERIRFVDDQRGCILGVAEAFGCLQQAEPWVQQILPFGCFVSYLGVGPDSVTFYYRSTALHRGKPAPRFVRGHGSVDAAAPQP
mgnify:CR=1 FL=1